MNKIKIKIFALLVAVAFSSFTVRGQLVNVQANTGNGTTNFITKWSAGSATFHIGDSQIQDDGSGVGIGTSPSASIKLTVNGSINSSSHYRIGNIPFVRGDLFSSVWVGDNILTLGVGNTVVGSNAGNNNTENFNTLIGSYTGFTGTGSLFYQNTAVGCSALFFSSRYGGTAVGHMAAYKSTLGCGVTAIGEQALFNNTEGSYNCAFGRHAGRDIITGSYNTFLGDFTNIATGSSAISYATAVGAGAIVNNSNEMILGNNSVYVGIGYSGVATYPPGKLSVDESAGEVSTPTIAGYFHNGDGTREATSSFIKRGIYAICDGRFTQIEGWLLTNIGGDFEASFSQVDNIAVRGLTGIVPEAEDNRNIGGWFEGNHAKSYNIGVHASAYGDAAANYGIYASAPLNVCSNGGPCYSAAGFFNGDVFTMDSYFASDAALKSNVQPLNNALAIINALQPKSYIYNTAQYPFLNLSHGPQDGLIAQEVQTVLPELVNSFKIPPRRDSTGGLDTIGTSSSFLAINYVKIIPYLIGAVNEQQQSIDSLRTQLLDLQNQINNCCSSSPAKLANPAINVELFNSIILNQNDPNPFAEETKITYNIPESIVDAKIIFFDNKGHIIQTVKINERGAGQLNVYASNLTSGIYSYSLIADGKVIDTKKMVCNK